MPDKLLGLNGLTTDETVTRFYLTWKGVILKKLWGDTFRITKKQALLELWSDRHAEVNAGQRGDPLAADRIREIDKTINAIDALPQ